MRFYGVIPARYESSRLPGKPLIEIAGRTLVEWVYRRTQQAALLDEVVVATDDERIADCVASFGGRAVMTDAGHSSGTDRVAEVAGRIDADVFVNIQGDEPLIAPETIDAICRPFLEDDPSVEVTTACVAITDPEDVASPHVNKVVTDRHGRALYFSRAAIPYGREGSPDYYKHIGIYGYRRDFLLNLKSLQPSRLEEAERLEQLRFLENGIAIRVVEVASDSPGVDVETDVERVRVLLQNEPQLFPSDRSG